MLSKNAVVSGIKTSLCIPLDLSSAIVFVFYLVFAFVFSFFFKLPSRCLILTTCSCACVIRAEDVSKRRPFESNSEEEMTNLSSKAMLKFQIRCNIVLYCKLTEWDLQEVM